MSKSQKVKENVAFIIGMPRSGTSSLYASLISDEKIFFDLNKEPKYFSKKGGLRELTFKIKKKNKIIIDASTDYFFQINYLNKIKNFNNNAKIILILREPTSWIFSLFKQWNRMKLVNNFEDLLFKTIKFNDKDFFKYKKNFLKNRIEFILSNFKNVLVIDFEKLDSLSTKKRLKKFLNIPMKNFSILHINSTLKKKSVLPIKNFIKIFLKYKLIKIILNFFLKKVSNFKNKKYNFDNKTLKFAKKQMNDDIIYYNKIIKRVR